ncbi:ATP-binding cassette, sub-B (MDR TAP), member 4, partial [Podila minutissima]
MASPSNNNLKEEFIEKELDPVPYSSHIVDMADMAATPSVDTLHEKQATSKKSKGNKNKKKGKKNGDAKDEDDKEEEEPEPKVSYLQLYRFASPWDWICIIIGTICAFVNGVGQPLIALLLGDVITTLTDNLMVIDDAVAKVRILVIKFTVVGAIAFVAAYGQMCFWTMSAENQSKRIREKYLHAILRQDISWHDIGKKSESLNSRLSADTQLIFDGLADKVGMSLMSLATFVAGFAVAFSNGWRMSLVLLTSVPLMAICGALMAKYTMESTSNGQGSYAKAGGLAEQAIGSIRTVFAFDGQKRELKKFSVTLDEAYKSGVKKAWATGIGMGSFMLIMFLSYSLAFWYGSREVKAGRMESGQPSNLTGHIVVRDVNFSYPSRPDVPILKNMNIEVKPGQTVALVGHSGSGKSTIVGLVERFYDPSSGSITLDGIEIRDFNVRHLRDSIGLVSQEPVLFNATIKQNI